MLETECGRSVTIFAIWPEFLDSHGRLFVGKCSWDAAKSRGLAACVLDGYANETSRLHRRVLDGFGIFGSGMPLGQDFSVKSSARSLSWEIHIMRHERSRAYRYVSSLLCKTS